MDSLFEDLRIGLEQAIEYERGSGTARVTTYVIQPVEEYSKSDIKTIRKNAGMTQAVFADFMGVSTKTVEAWERGRTHPTGPACRLMNILASGKGQELSFVSSQ